MIVINGVGDIDCKNGQTGRKTKSKGGRGTTVKKRTDGRIERLNPVSYLDIYNEIKILHVPFC